MKTIELSLSNVSPQVVENFKKRIAEAGGESSQLTEAERPRDVVSMATAVLAISANGLVLYNEVRRLRTELAAESKASVSDLDGQEIDLVEATDNQLQEFLEEADELEDS